MKSNHPDVAPDYYSQVGNLRTGHQILKTLLTGTPGALNNYRWGLGGGGDTGDWTTPRHKHAFEQIRYPLSGDYIIGKDEVLPAGWVAYFPESASYGPQNKTANLMMLTLQFGGPSGIGYYTLAERKQAYEELVAKPTGKFENGIYSWTDEDGRRHNLDSAEAVWTQYQKGKMDYPEGRFRDLVMMNPAAFTFVKDRDQPGVAHKKMGTFTEREIKVGFIHLDKGASLKFGTTDAPELLFVDQGSVSHDGKTHPKWSAMSTEAGETPNVLTANEESQLFYVKLPTF